MKKELISYAILSVGGILATGYLAYITYVTTLLKRSDAPGLFFVYGSLCIIIGVCTCLYLRLLYLFKVRFVHAQLINSKLITLSTAEGCVIVNKKSFKILLKLISQFRLDDTAPPKYALIVADNKQWICALDDLEKTHTLSDAE